MEVYCFSAYVTGARLAALAWLSLNAGVVCGYWKIHVMFALRLRLHAASHSSVQSALRFAMGYFGLCRSILVLVLFHCFLPCSKDTGTESRG
ncbi:hypothetical protein P692DRAFT_20836674 [Suillus brevipes Sb2]|nr:hypothetical protein P692DRAFT_20836674 [Suillus brevipes Sb2]